MDSKEKRQNVIGVGRPWMRNHFPVAVPDTEWRAASGLSYGANGLTGSPVAKQDVASFVQMSRRRRL